MPGGRPALLIRERVWHEAIFIAFSKGEGHGV